MKPNFFSKFSKKQKIIAAILSVCMVLSIIQAGIWTMNQREIAAATELTDPLADPETAFAKQANILSSEGSSYYTKSKTFYKNGDYATALSWINKAIDKDGDLPLLLFQRSMIGISSKNYASAIDDYTRILTVYPDYTNLYKLRGSLYMEANNNKLAYADFTQYLDVVSNDTEVLTLHANLAVLLEKYDTALSDVDTLLALDSQNGSLFALKGDLLMLLSRTDEAETAYLQAADYLSGDTLASIWSALGTLYQSKPDYDKAIAAYEKYLSIAEKDNSDNGEVWFQLGLCQIQKETYDEATTSFSEALAMNYETALSHFQRGLCYYSQGESAKAADDLQQYVDNAGEDISTSAYIYLALSYINTGNNDSAATYFEKCIDNAIMPAESHYYLGLIDLQNGNASSAVTHLSAAISEDFKQPTCYYNRGIAYLRQNDIDEAQSDFKTVISLGSDSELTKAAQTTLTQIDEAKKAALKKQQQALAQAAAEKAEAESSNTQQYHTVIIQEGTADNPSAVIDQNTQNTQTAK